MAETIGTAYVQIEPSFDGVVPKIDKEFGGAGEKSGKSFGQGFASVAGTVGKAAAGAAAAGAAAVAGLAKSAVSAYSDYEQLAGGTELLFGRTAEETEALRQSMLDSGMSARQVADEIAGMSDASDMVMQNAETAFSRVQMSMNDYLQTANGYATGLKESLGGDAYAAAELTDKIITAQADIVAATGNNAENVANAFAGIMKNNFTMLDNLQLGIKPTKEGMQEVIDKMNELNGTEYEMGNLADMQAAIVDYVDYVGMAGYASNEAAGTIQGSLASTKAAWENLLSTLGTGDDNAINTAINNLVTSATQLGSNIMPIMQNALGGISQLISELGPKIAEVLPGMIAEVLPGLLSAGVEIVQNLATGILSALPELVPAALDIVMQLCDTILGMLPQLIDVGMQVITSLAQGIAQALPQLIPQIVETVMQVIETFVENLPQLIDCGIQIIMALIEGIINAIPVLISHLPEIIVGIVEALVAALPKLIQGAIQLVHMIVENLPTIIQALIDAIPEIIVGIVQALTDPANVEAIIMGAIQLVAALVGALPQIILALIEAIPSIIMAIVEAFAEMDAALVNLFTQIMTDLGPTFDKLGEFAKKAWEAIKKVFSKTGAWFKTQFQTAYNNIKNVFSSIGQFFQSVWEKIVSVFSGAAEKFKEVGRQIVNGIKNGLSSSWSNLKSFLQKACGDLIALAKRILGIASPSKEFADQVGRWIPAGIAEGIKSNMGVLDNAISGLSDGMLSASVSGTMETVNSANYAMVGAAGAEEKPVVITNNITVNGAEDPEAWTQTFIRTLKREARMA